MTCRASGCVSTYVGPKTGHSAVGRVAPASKLARSGLLSNFTWSGGTPAGPNASDWSNATNWSGGVAPHGSVGTLDFPALTSAACTAKPPTDTCYQGIDNIAGLAANALSIDDGVGYYMQGDAIKLGAGGLSASTASTSFNGPTSLFMPFALTAPQTWALNGNNVDGQVGLQKPVAGSTHALTIQLDNETFLNLAPANVEVGPITIDTTSTKPVANGSVALQTGAKLNATDGNSVSLTGTGTGIFAAGNSAVGPLDASGGDIQVGNGTQGAAVLSVSGGFTQNGSNTLTLNVIGRGTKAGTDYSQLSAAGAVSLAGSLDLSGSTSTSSPTCPTLQVGDVDTVVTTTGTLTGTFSGIPNGTTVSLDCSGGVAPTGRINYMSNSVTFTVLTAGGPPSITNVFPNAGSTAGGNTVIIRGANFVNGATVKFGTIASSKVTFVSAGELKAAAPAEASGVVDITVTSNGATTATSSRDLYAYGPPTVTSFDPTSGPVGTVVTITGTDFVPRATVKFGATAATSVTFVSPTQIKATVPTGASTGPISVSTPAGTGTSSSNFTVT